MKRTITIRLAREIIELEYKYTAIGDLTPQEFDEEVVVITGSKAMSRLIDSLKVDFQPYRVKSVHTIIEK